MIEIDIKSKSIADLKDPFTQECIESVWFWCNKNTFRNSIEYRATVKFKNGNTTGEQKFDAESFEMLVRKVDNFTKSL